MAHFLDSLLLPYSFILRRPPTPAPDLTRSRGSVSENRPGKASSRECPGTLGPTGMMSVISLISWPQQQLHYPGGCVCGSTKAQHVSEYNGAG